LTQIKNKIKYEEYKLSQKANKEKMLINNQNSSSFNDEEKATNQVHYKI